MMSLDKVEQQKNFLIIMEYLQKKLLIRFLIKQNKNRRHYKNAINGQRKRNNAINTKIILTRKLPKIVEKEGSFMNKQLTEREKEVMQYVCKGYTNKEIGKIIFVSASTVKKHMQSILEKLNVKNRAEAVYEMMHEHSD